MMGNERPVLLDLFCGAGGAAMGYSRAGFDIVGVDVKPQPHYPFRFVQADALAYLKTHWRAYDAIHASPPCQAYSNTANMPWTNAAKGESPKMVEEVRNELVSTGLPYIIENVKGAPLIDAIVLCGLMFGLNVFRHRLFESNTFMLEPTHVEHSGRRIGVGGMCCVVGHGDCGKGRVPVDHRNMAAWKQAMGIDWMTRAELTQAIPPAYTQFVGSQLLKAVVL